MKFVPTIKFLSDYDSKKEMNLSISMQLKYLK